METILHTAEAHSQFDEEPAFKRTRLLNAMRASLFVFLALLGSSCAGEIEKRQLVELRKIASETPIYPELQKTGEKAVLKPGIVYFNTYFRSTAQFSDIRAFYDRVLAEKRWGSPERSGEKNWVRHRRGDYVIDIEQDERKPDNFDIVFIWDPQ